MNLYWKLQSIQKQITGCWKHHFDKIQLTNSKNTSRFAIYRWTHWVTRWQPTEFIELYQSWWFGFIDNQDCQLGDRSVWTRKLTRSNGPVPLLTVIATNWRRIKSALSLLSNCSQASIGSKQSAISVTKWQGPSRSCFKRFCPEILDQCSVFRYTATHSFFHLLNVLNLGSPNHLANCFKVNSIWFNLIGAVTAAPPKSD
jgi:hypothetical protein